MHQRVFQRVPSGRCQTLSQAPIHRLCSLFEFRNKTPAWYSELAHTGGNLHIRVHLGYYGITWGTMGVNGSAWLLLGFYLDAFSPIQLRIKHKKAATMAAVRCYYVIILENARAK